MVQRKKQKSEESNRKERRIFSRYIMPIFAIILIIVAFSGAYYFVITPNLISKPFIEKPFLPDNSLVKIKEKISVINSSHIDYILNEIGTYKLHATFGTDNFPIIEFTLTDINKTFYSYVYENKPITKQGYSKNKDIIVKGDQETLFNILKSNDVLGSVKEAKNNNAIQVELISDMNTLIAKGYFSVYDSLK